jgi:hypothetical protein
MSEKIRAAIRKLPDEEIKPLLVWLGDYYHGAVWDRQIAQDSERLGPAEFARRLVADPAARDERPRANPSAP